MVALLDKSTRVALEYNFLYLEDYAAFDIFISSLGIEQRGFNLRFRQAIFTKIVNNLEIMYKKRQDREYIISAVQKLVFDDINRLEIMLAVSSYIYGKKSTTFANELENYFLINYPEIKISKDMKLIRKKLSSKDYRFRNRLILELISSCKLDEKFSAKVDDFFDERIKENIYNLNNYIHKQVKLEFKDNQYFVFQKETFLTKKELEQLYSHIKKIFIEHFTKTSKRFIWYGLNDKVISRYKG